MIKRFKKITNQFVSIAILLFLGTASFGQTSSGTIDLTVDTFKEFEVFGDTLDNYSVYFTGENHNYTTFNTQFEFKLLKYLNQTQNVKHFVFEQSPGLSYVINKIVLENETTHLHYLRDMFFDPFYELVKEIRSYNDSLELEDKIQVHGIDIERFPSFSLYALNEMVENLDYRVEGGEIFEQIKALASSDYKDKGADAYYAEYDKSEGFVFGEVSAWYSLESIIRGANENRDSLKTALGVDSTIFYSIIESLEVGHEWYINERLGDVKSPIVRERFMADEFERIYLQDMEGKYYGQFGRCHLQKDQKARGCYAYYMNSIANRINDINPKLKNQVLVIPIFYNGDKLGDSEFIKDLELDSRYLDSKESFIIDLAYSDEKHSITGFYNDLPFVIICNSGRDLENFYEYNWDINKDSYHLGAGIGYTFFNKLSKLNAVLENNSLLPFDKQVLHYSLSSDYFIINDQGGGISFVYYPQISNGDRFDLKGFNVSAGTNYSVGNRFFLTAFGLDLGYGKMKLIETQTPTADPNLIQINNLNKTIYTNDLFTVDPNLKIRLTLPVISLNIKAGYILDVSGKYWKLDGKIKDFTKTNFSAPYVEVGASFNFKM